MLQILRGFTIYRGLIVATCVFLAEKLPVSWTTQFKNLCIRWRLNHLVDECKRIGESDKLLVLLTA